MNNRGTSASKISPKPHGHVSSPYPSNNLFHHRHQAKEKYYGCLTSVSVLHVNVADQHNSTNQQCWTLYEGLQSGFITPRAPRTSPSNIIAFKACLKPIALTGSNAKRMISENYP